MAVAALWLTTRSADWRAVERREVERLADELATGRIRAADGGVPREGIGSYRRLYWPHSDDKPLCTPAERELVSNTSHSALPRR